MLKPTHLAGGMACATFASTTIAPLIPSLFPVTLSDIALMVIGTTIGALFPDIDTPHSYMGRRLALISWIANKTVGHRGAFHSLLGAAFFTGLAALLLSSFCPMPFLSISLFYFAVGYLSHLFLDACTRSGVPLFFPFSRYHVRLLGIRTSSFKKKSKGEQFFFILLNLFAICWTWYYFIPLFLSR